MTETAAPLDVTRWRGKSAGIGAVRWDGTVSNATAIINWIVAEGGTARYRDESDLLAVDAIDGARFAAAGDWIASYPAGTFRVFTEDEITAAYEPAGLDAEVAKAVTAQREALTGFFLMVTEDGEIALSAPCADSLGCLWGATFDGVRVQLEALIAAALGHTGTAAGRLHATLATSVGEGDRAAEMNNGRPVAWSSAVAPGGWVCAVPVPGNRDDICGMPVESEPCREHEEAGNG